MGYDGKGPIKDAEEGYIEVCSLKEESVWVLTGVLVHLKILEKNNISIFDLYSQKNFLSLFCHSPLQAGKDM